MLTTALISKILNKQKILTVSNWHPLEEKDLYQEQDQTCWQPLGEQDVEQEEDVDNSLKTKDEKTVLEKAGKAKDLVRYVLAINSEI